MDTASSSPERHAPRLKSRLLSPIFQSATPSTNTRDYRGLIDELTLEVQRLRRELKGYKLSGPNILEEKLFEVRLHGVPAEKRGELEMIFRDFARRHDTRRVPPLQPPRQDLVEPWSAFRMLSPCPGRKSQPLGTTFLPKAARSEDRVRVSSRFPRRGSVQNCLPRQGTADTIGAKQNLIVHQLEQHFISNACLRSSGHTRLKLSSTGVKAERPIPVIQGPDTNQASQATTRQWTSPCADSVEAAECRTRRPEVVRSAQRKRRDTREKLPLSLDVGYSACAMNANGSSTRETILEPGTYGALPKRPTSSTELDLEGVPLPLRGAEGMLPDAQGWVYLNLACNWAELHMANVTPDMVRYAVLNLSNSLELSADGRMIRWRGGYMDYSANLQVEGQEKRQRDEDTPSALFPLNKIRRICSDSASRTAQLTRSGNFHYSPLFYHEGFVECPTTFDSSLGSVGISNDGGSRWDITALDSSKRGTKEHVGVIIYYTHAPFYVDLSKFP